MDWILDKELKINTNNLLTCETPIGKFFINYIFNDAHFSCHLSLGNGVYIGGTKGENCLVEAKEMAELYLKTATTVNGLKQKPTPTPTPTKIGLVWSDPKPPTKDVSNYDHIICQTPLGRMIIEWKSWKNQPSYDVELDGVWSFCVYDLEEAKQKAETYLRGKSEELITFLST